MLYAALALALILTCAACAPSGTMPTGETVDPPVGALIACRLKTPGWERLCPPTP